jgi:hypothetical protein
VLPIEGNQLVWKKHKIHHRRCLQYDTCPLGFMAQKSDPLMTDIRNKYGDRVLERSRIDGSFDSLQIKNAKEKPQEFEAISKAVKLSRFCQFLPFEVIVGSSLLKKNKKMVK